MTDLDVVDLLKVVTKPPFSAGHAQFIAGWAHTAQRDKTGQPYIHHPGAVAAMLEPFGELAVMAGWLHDVVEDSPVTLDHLAEAGCPPEVIAAVDSVTKRPGETYMAMIGRAAADPLGRLVKIADNAHNTARLGNLPPTEAKRLGKRYAAARSVLYAAAVAAGDKIPGGQP